MHGVGAALILAPPWFAGAVRKGSEESPQIGVDASNEGPEDHLGDMHGFDFDTVATMVFGMPEYRRSFSADDRGRWSWRSRI